MDVSPGGRPDRSEGRDLHAPCRMQRCTDQLVCQAFEGHAPDDIAWVSDRAASCSRLGDLC